MQVTSEKTNNAGTSQTPKSNASKEKDKDVELIVVPSTVPIPEEIVDSRTSSTKSKKEKILTVPQQEEKTVNTGRLDHDDSLMPELEIFHKPETGIFDEASYDEEGMITDFNSLPTEIEVIPTPTLRIHRAHALQGFVTPSSTKVNASGEEQVEDISLNTLEAAKTLSKVASLKPRSIDKGRRYKRRKEAKGKKVVSSLDFQEEVDTGAEQVNTAKGVSTASTKFSTGSEQVSTVGDKKSTSSPDKG
ncbi:hypothetical protein Tco_0102201, partial [Tanacetum coccineum]